VCENLGKDAGAELGGFQFRGDGRIKARGDEQIRFIPAHHDKRVGGAYQSARSAAHGVDQRAGSVLGCQFEGDARECGQLLLRSLKLADFFREFVGNEAQMLAVEPF
jgi:hypothetical protein